MKWNSVIFVIVIALILVAYQNCAKKVNFSSATVLGQGEQIDPGKDAPDIITATDDTDIIPSCSNTTLKTKYVDISFPYRQDCAWNQNGNLGMRDRYMQARVAEVREISLPANSTLCHMEFEFAEQTFEYDDQVFLALNNRILMTTAGDVLAKYLNHDGSGYIFNWSRLVGKSQDVGGTNIYCNGENATCTLPRTDIAGKILLDIPKSTIQKIMTMSPQTPHLIKLVTTGDNDNHDCRHEGVSFRVKVTYHD